MKNVLTICLLSLLFVTTAQAFTFSRNLNLGSTGEDVKQLQVFLNNYSNETKISNDGLGSPGNETNYFGTLTQNALKKFQEINYESVLKPVNLFSGTGYFGPSTINFVNSFSINQNVKTANQTQQQNQIFSNKPVIYSISPEEGVDGTEITIKGSGFTNSNIIISAFESQDKYTDYKSNSFGTEITFKLDSVLQKKFDEKTQKLNSGQKENVLNQIVDVPISILIKNENGESNYKIFNFKFK